MATTLLWPCLELVSAWHALYEKGFFSAEEISNSSLEDLMQIRGIAEEKAIKLLETAKKYVANADTSDEVSNKISSDNTLSDDNTSESIESSVSDIQENIGADKGDDEDAFSNAPLTDFEEKNSE